MRITPDLTIQEIVAADSCSASILENYGVDLHVYTERTLEEISEARFLQLDDFINDLNVLLNSSN
jgi:hypothetical protein